MIDTRVSIIGTRIDKDGMFATCLEVSRNRKLKRFFVYRSLSGLYIKDRLGRQSSNVYGNLNKLVVGLRTDKILERKM